MHCDVCFYKSWHGKLLFSYKNNAWSIDYYTLACYVGSLTVTGHAACTYEKILSNDYILQSRSDSLYNIGLYFSAV